MSILNVQLLCRKSKKDFLKLSLFAFWPGAIINPQWFKLPISQTNFYSLCRGSLPHQWNVIVSHNHKHCDETKQKAKWQAETWTKEYHIHDQDGPDHNVQNEQSGPDHNVQNEQSEPSCSNLHRDTQICWNFLLKKIWVAFAVQKLLTFFQQKISEYCILNPLKQLTKWPLTSSLS